MHNRPIPKRQAAAALLIVIALFAGSLMASHKSDLPSLSGGEPPPDNALNLSVQDAQALLKQSVEKRSLGLMFGKQKVRIGSFEFTDWKEKPARDLRVSCQRLSFFVLEAQHTTTHGKPQFFGSAKTQDDTTEPQDLHIFYDFAAVPAYVQPAAVVKKHLYTVVYPGGARLREYQGFYWNDEDTAQKFADAFNRLAYAAHHGEACTPEFADFSAAADKWRQNPVKPPLSTEADRHRILAENAIKEEDLYSAVEHYEAGLQADPMWPQGWFNAAMIYAELHDYADAGDRMKHYLVLAPDAPDAKAAREQMIIWEDKANTGPAELTSPPSPRKAAKKPTPEKKRS